MGADDQGDQPESKYANFFEVGFNAYEFIIDFGQYYSGETKVKPVTRILTSPVHAKKLLATLRNSIENHRRTFSGPG